MGKKSRSKQQRQNTKKPQAQQRVEAVIPSATMLGAKLAGGPQVKNTEVDYGYVRSDIRRILILLVVMVAVLTTSVIVNSRSNLLQRAGSAIARFLELQ
jgi:hypothetical protein